MLPRISPRAGQLTKGATLGPSPPLAAGNLRFDQKFEDHRRRPSRLRRDQSLTEGLICVIPLPHQPTNWQGGPHSNVRHSGVGDQRYSRDGKH